MTTTTLSYSGTTTDAAPSTTPQQLRTLGTFTKAAAGSTIELTWSSHVSGVGTTVCNFSIRVDGVASPTGDLGAVIFLGTNLYFPVSVTRTFTGLAAGTHTVSLWTRGVSATSCTDNPGNYTRYVMVKEF